MKRPASQQNSHSTRFHRCPSCRYWVTPADPHCANCGRVHPFPRAADAWRGLAEGFVGGGLLLAFFAAMVGVSSGELAVPFMFGAIVGAPVGVALDAAYADAKRNRDCLQQYERTIKLRLKEIDRVLNRIETIRKRLGPTPAPELRKVAEALDAAERIYPAHRDRYRIKLFEIDLVRWMNAVEPYGYGGEGLSFEGCERRLTDLATLQQRGEDLRSSLSQSGIAAEVRIPFAARLEQGLALCERFRQSLITRQTLTVVAGASAVREDAALAGTPPVEDRLNDMGARAEIGQFAQGLSTLEAEHARIEAELEVSQLTLGAGRG